MVVMFFLMYLNSYQIFDHAWFSETRLFMALIMGAAMMFIMLAFMLGMYKKQQGQRRCFCRICFTAAAFCLVGTQSDNGHRRRLYGSDDSPSFYRHLDQ